MTAKTTAQEIVSLVQDEAARISATGNYDKIIDGYRACSALVLRKALDDAKGCSFSDAETVDYLDEVLAELEGEGGSDKAEIVSQITDLLQKLVG